METEGNVEKVNEYVALFQRCVFVRIWKSGNFLKHILSHSLDLRTAFQRGHKSQNVQNQNQLLLLPQAILKLPQKELLC